MNREQLKAILWLRVRLARNQWARSAGFGALWAAVLAVGAVGLAAVSFGGATLVGAFVLGSEASGVHHAVWLIFSGVFLFLWLIGLLTELQRSETINLQRLMHLPVALGQIFTLNYLASHFTLSLVITVPAMVGLGVGLAVARGPGMLLLLPLSMSFVFMVTAWTYCLRGWLATLMANPRKRRTAVMTLTAIVIVVAQLPNLYFNVLGPGGKHRSHRADAAQASQLLERAAPLERFVPPLWLAAGAAGLAEGEAGTALLGTLGGALVGAWGLYRAYRSTVRFYQGESDGREARAKASVALTPTGQRSDRRTTLLDRRIPGLSEETSSVLLATLQCMARAPEMKMVLGSSFLVTILVGGSLLFRHSDSIPVSARPFVVLGAVAMSTFILVQAVSNQYGFDRDGFRSYILSPTPRRSIVLGKNIAYLFVTASLGSVLMLAMAIWLRLPPLGALAAVLQGTFVLLMMNLVGSFASIVFPYRITPGSLKPTKMPGLNVLVLLAFQFLGPLTISPALLPPAAEWLWNKAGMPAFPVSLLLSALLVAAMGLAYLLALAPLGRLLEQRETKILAAVTVENE